MRAYTFVHKYICGIQVGIQAGHSIVEMMVDHRDNKDVVEWASAHKTFTWLDGGDSDNMAIIVELLEKTSIPYSLFREPALDSLTTSISFVLNSEQVELCNQIRLEGLSPCPTNRGYYIKENGQVALTDQSVTEEPILSRVACSRTKSL